MAKVVFGGAVAEVRGTIGADVYTRNRSGGIIRTKSLNAFIHTDARDAAIDDLNYLLYKWSYTLSEEDRQKWRTYADAQTPSATSLATNHLTGQQWFLRLSLAIYWDGLEPPNTPPTSTSVQQPINLTIVLIKVSTSEFLVSYAPIPLPDTSLNLYGTYSISPGIQAWTRMTGAVSTLDDTDTPPVNIWTRYTTTKGAPVAGMKIGLIGKYTNDLNGFVSRPIRADAIVQP